MIYILLIIFLFLMVAKVDVYSASIFVLLFWSFPAFIAGEVDKVFIMYMVSIGFMLIIKILSKPDKINLVIPVLISKISTVFLLTILSLILFFDAGLSGFLGGKYGPIPGGDIYLFYMFNSIVYVSFVLLIFSNSKSILFLNLHLLCMFLLFIYGDRTIIIFCFFVYLLKQTYAKKGYEVLLNIRLLTLLLMGLLIVVFGKLFHGLYAAGAMFEASMMTDSFFDMFMSLESWHNYRLFKSIVDTGFVFDFNTFLSGLLAVFPASSVFDVDPHAFSKAVKAEFYSDWSEDKGVGASYYGEFYAVGGAFGFSLGLALQILYLVLLSFSLKRHKLSLMTIITLILSAPWVFYLYRNSLEQILSFSGRYMLIFCFIYSVYLVFLAIKRKFVK